MYRLRLSNRAKKELKKLAAPLKPKIIKTLNLLTVNPLLGEKMSGDFAGSYRIKIPPIRIIYTPDFKNRIITIMAIGHRGDIYKQ